jgi:hypothetical protein
MRLWFERIFVQNFSYKYCAFIFIKCSMFLLPNFSPIYEDGEPHSIIWIVSSMLIIKQHQKTNRLNMDLIPYDLNQGILNNKSMTYDLFYTVECELQEHKGHTFVVWLFEFIKKQLLVLGF